MESILNYFDDTIAYNPFSSILLEASAGSGKTTIMVDRYLSSILALAIQNIQEEKDPLFEKVFSTAICITFTNLAAAELKKRVYKKLKFLFGKKENLESFLEKMVSSGLKILKENEINLWTEKLLEKSNYIDSYFSLARISTMSSFAFSMIKQSALDLNLDFGVETLDETKSFSSLEKECEKTFIMDHIATNKSLSLYMLLYGYHNTLVDIHELYLFLRDQDIKNFEKDLISSTSIEVKDFFEKINTLELDQLEKSLFYFFKEEMDEILESIPQKKSPKWFEEFRNFHKNFQKENAFILFTHFPKIPASLKQVPTKENLMEERERILSKLQKLTNKANSFIFLLLFNATRDLHFEIQKEKKLKQKISFYDIENIFYQNLSQKGSFFETVVGKISFLMIDEYQDTSVFQFALYKLFMKQDHITSFLVGDPKQCIYAFRGSDENVFEKTKKFFLEKSGKSSLKFLMTNYRSNSNLVSSFNALFTHVFDNTSISYQDQKAFKETQIEKRFIFSYEDETDENLKKIDQKRNSIFEKVKCILKDFLHKGYHFSDILLLSRKNPPLEFVLDLKRTFPNIEISLPLHNFFESEMFRPLLVYLKAIEHYQEDICLVALLKSIFFRLNDDEILLLFQEKEKSSLFDYLKSNFSQREKEWDIFKTLISKKDHLMIADLFSILIEESGFLIYLQSFEHFEENSQILKSFLLELYNYQVKENISLLTFLYRLDNEEIMNFSSLNQMSINQNTLRWLTIHSAKGLESPVVLFLDMFSDSHKKDKVLYKDQKIGKKYFYGEMDTTYEVLADLKDLQEKNESKRLVYVAITRAKEYFFYLAMEKTSFDFIDKDLFDSLKYPNIAFLPYEHYDNSFIIEQNNTLNIETSFTKSTMEQYESIKDFSFDKTFILQKLTITQLLDFEFLPQDIFLKRYLTVNFSLSDAFLQIIEENENLKANDKGTLFHEIFEKTNKDTFLDFIQNHPLSEADQEEIIKKSTSFFEHEMTRKFLSEAKETFKELSLSYKDPSTNVFILGTIDLLFKDKKDKFILIDYKLSIPKDNIRYKRQLEYYRFLLKQMDIIVSEAYLYNINKSEYVLIYDEKDGSSKNIQDVCFVKNIKNILKLF